MFKKHVAVFATVVAAMVMVCGIKADAAGMNVSASISGDKVVVNAASSSAPASDDGMLYLFAEPVYSGGITTQPIAQAPAAPNATFSVALDKKGANSKLYSQFVVATMKGGAYVPVNRGAFITNPEAVASRRTPRRSNPAVKKGLLVDSFKIQDGRELVDLGVRQAMYNFPIGNLIGPTTNGAYPTINYEYMGKTYQFNGLVVAEYDTIFGILNNKGIAISCAILNNQTGRNSMMIHPQARGGACPYYMFNAAEADGVRYLAAALSFIANRYGGEKAMVDNWIIGNEVTAPNQWNWMGPSPEFNNYVNEYEKVLRVAYNAIKSESANSNVYVCIDQQWNRNMPANNIDGYDMLKKINADFRETGNISWGVACHPYPVPLTTGAYWAEANPYYKSLVKHAETSPFLTMQNIEVLTDLLCKPEFICPDGQVRSVICSEVGYTAAQGEDLQAAAFVQGYLQAMANQHIDAFLYTRQTDTAEEIAQGLSMGLTNPGGGGHKKVYDFYKNIDKGNAEEYIQQANAIFGGDLRATLSPR